MAAPEGEARKSALVKQIPPNRDRQQEVAAAGPCGVFIVTSGKKDVLPRVYLYAYNNKTRLVLLRR